MHEWVDLSINANNEVILKLIRYLASQKTQKSERMLFLSVIKN